MTTETQTGVIPETASPTLATTAQHGRDLMGGPSVRPDRRCRQTRVGSLTAPERETIVNMSDADDLVRIWTSQRSNITAMRRKPEHFTEVGSGMHGTSPWAEFTTVTDRWNLATGARRRGTPRPNLRAAATPLATGDLAVAVGW